MKVKTDKIHRLISEIDEIIDNLNKVETEHKKEISEVCDIYKKSAVNLLHYNVLRSYDLRSIQKRLKNLGMSRFAKSEEHVKASLLSTRYILKCLIDERPQNFSKSGLSIKNGKRLLNNHTKELIGFRSKGRRVRIMVTQPTEAAYDYEVVNKMVRSGMNVARVNCAHDGPEIWKKIILNVRKAGRANGRKIKISMDLAGPKIRTGAIEPGAKVKKFVPERDDMGNMLNPVVLTLVKELTIDSEPNTVPVDPVFLHMLEIGDRINFTDTRGKHRSLKVIELVAGGARVNCYETSYIGTGSSLVLERDNNLIGLVGEIPSIEQFILLRQGDLLEVVKEDILGQPSVMDEDGNVINKARISCQLKEVFGRVQINEKVLFDDGKIEGIVVETSPGSFHVRITRAKEGGAKLKAEKGINFPTTDMGISGLTEKDKEDLKFVAMHADIVNFSFVNSASDVAELLSEFDKLGARDKLSIILKIETRRAFDNLAEILLEAMKIRYVGVMIARGDLAVETGWNRIGRVQKEILSICSAAHIPVVWATQVLENLAKKGLPSRSEITDATASLKAECVMLNKGAYINEAIKLLDGILGSMESHHEKNDEMLPQLQKLMS